MAPNDSVKDNAGRGVHGCVLCRVPNREEESTMGLILLVVLVVLLMGGLPRWGYSRNWGYGPSGGLGLLLVIVLVLLLAGYIPRGF
jgi:Protein of unknown function (DUF3309)